MRQEAERFAEEDKVARELVEIRNEADQACYATESSLKDHSDKMEEGEVEKINSALASLQEIKDASDATVDSIRAALDALNEASHDLARRIYEQAAQEPAADAGPSEASSGGEPQGSSEPAGEDPVVDADFKVKD